MSKDDKLSLIQREFVRQYLIHRNATKAAREAGYSEKSAHVQGSRLLSNARVSAAIKKGEEKVIEKFDLKQEKILEQLHRMAFFDPMSVLEWKRGKLVFKEDLAGAYLSAAGFTIYPEYQSQADQRNGILRAKLSVSIMAADRKAALELLGKHIGLWKGDNGTGSGAGEEPRKDVLKRVHELFRKHRERGGSGTGTDP